MSAKSAAADVGASGVSASTQMFVINLAASTSPMALAHPGNPELKRFTFFVSRQREEGRERFRLHMGYFATQDEAEALLVSVRDIYPAAWAGPAPTTGTGRRGRIAPGRVVPAAPVPAIALAAAPAAAAAASAPVAAATAPVTAAAPAPVAPPTLEEMSNVRDVIAQLSEAPAAAAAKPASGAPLPAAPASAGAELNSAATLSLLESAPRNVPTAAPVARAAPPAMPAAAAPVVAAPLAATAPREAPPPLKNPFAGLENEPEVRLVTPEDTQTLTDIKVDRQNNAPLCFAVQLVWSVTPIDVATLAHLAIFDAYTLYNVEGNRQGRRWYGLRLGFFTDPNSAAQVANYVRSEYRSVAVVPVAVKERDRARGGAPAPESTAKTSDTDITREPMNGFELLTDDKPVAARRDLESTARMKVAAAVGMPPRVPVVAPGTKPAGAAPAAAPKATGKPTGKRVVARRRPPQVTPGDRTVSSGVGGPDVLESTLEILGASTLSLAEDGRESISDAAGRDPRKQRRAGRFSRLLSKLGGG